MSDQVEEKKETQEKEIKVQPYKIYGCDFSITDPDYIDYYKTRFKIMAIKYNLVGRVNDKGIYVIPNDVKSDLVRMSKEIEDMGEDYYYASNVYMKKYFYFKIELTMLEDNKAKASLYLMEKVDDFLEEEFITTHIADYIDDYNEQYRIKLRQKFNLVDVAVPISDMVVPNLAVVMQDNYDIGLFVGGLYDIASQIYLLRMLKLLESGGENGQAILARYKQLLISLQGKIDKEKYKNTMLKSLLDRAIDEYGGLEKLRMDKVLIKQAINEINGSIKAIDKAQKRPGAIEGINVSSGGSVKASASKKDGNKKDKKKEEKKGKDKAKAKSKAKKETSINIYEDAWEDAYSSSDSSSSSSSTSVDNSDNNSIDTPSEDNEVQETVIVENKSNELDLDADDISQEIGARGINLDDGISEELDSTELDLDNEDLNREIDNPDKLSLDNEIGKQLDSKLEVEIEIEEEIGFTR